jgi:hypothetical protein
MTYSDGIQGNQGIRKPTRLPEVQSATPIPYRRSSLTEFRRTGTESGEREQQAFTIAPPTSIQPIDGHYDYVLEAPTIVTTSARTPARGDSLKLGDHRMEIRPNVGNMWLHNAMGMPDNG